MHHQPRVTIVYSIMWNHYFQDVQYADIDHMEEQRIFTVDNKNFAGLNGYFESLRAGGMHTIIILVSACF